MNSDELSLHSGAEVSNSEEQRDLIKQTLIENQDEIIQSIIEKLPFKVDPELVKTVVSKVTENPEMSKGEVADLISSGMRPSIPDIEQHLPTAEAKLGEIVRVEKIRAKIIDEGKEQMLNSMADKLVKGEKIGYMDVFLLSKLAENIGTTEESLIEIIKEKANAKIEKQSRGISLDELTKDMEFPCVQMVKKFIHDLRYDLIEALFEKYGSEAMANLEFGVDGEHADLLTCLLLRMQIRCEEPEDTPDVSITLQGMINGDFNRILDGTGDLSSGKWIAEPSTNIPLGYRLVNIDHTTFKPTLNPSVDGNHSWKHNYKNQIKMIRYLLTLDLVAKKCPQLITNEVMSAAVWLNIPRIIMILSGYRIEPEDPEKVCEICCLSYPDDLITSPCECAYQVHIHCLDRVVIADKNRCGKCKSSFKCEQWLEPGPGYGVRFYPSVDVYPCTAFPNSFSIHCEDLPKTFSTQLHLAVVYLQVERVKELLEMMTMMDLEIYVKEALELREYEYKPTRKYINERFSYIESPGLIYRIHYVKDNTLLLLDNLNNGVSRKSKAYGAKFNIIEDLLNDKLTSYAIDVDPHPDLGDLSMNVHQLCHKLSRRINGITKKLYDIEYDITGYNEKNYRREYPRFIKTMTWINGVIVEFSECIRVIIRRIRQSKCEHIPELRESINLLAAIDHLKVLKEINKGLEEMSQPVRIFGYSMFDDAMYSCASKIIKFRKSLESISSSLIK